MVDTETETAHTIHIEQRTDGRGGCDGDGDGCDRRETSSMHRDMIRVRRETRDARKSEGECCKPQATSHTGNGQLASGEWPRLCLPTFTRLAPSIVLRSSVPVPALCHPSTSNQRWTADSQAAAYISNDRSKYTVGRGTRDSD